jgi:hypothetical protein
MSRYYDRNGKPMELMEWVRVWGPAEDRRVGNDHIGDVDISTVWIGLDHQCGDGPPLIFETMVFGGPYNEYTERYTTEAQARRGHKRIVARLRAGKAP